MIDLSIIIPTFNRLWALPEAVNSCRGSSAKVEIIVVDDGSSDGTWEWLQAQPDVTAIRQQNLGKDWAVNEGFAVAKGAYVRFLDSDDLIATDANDRQLEIARDTDADVVVGGHVVWFHDTNQRLRRPWTHCDDFIAQQLGECDSSHYSAYIFRHSFAASVPHRQEYAFRDDRMFIIECALKDPRVAIAPIESLIHRHHNAPRLQFHNGLTESVVNWQALQMYRRAAHLLEARGQLTLRRRKALTRVLWPLAHWIARSHPTDGCKVARWIYELDRDFRPPETGVLGFLYRRFGFQRTEQILRLRRRLVVRSPISSSSGDLWGSEGMEPVR